MNIKKEF